MIIFRKGKWSTKKGLIFTYDRLYYKGWWTPFCKIKITHLETQEEKNCPNKCPYSVIYSNQLIKNAIKTNIEANIKALKKKRKLND